MMSLLTDGTGWIFPHASGSLEIINHFLHDRDVTWEKLNSTKVKTPSKVFILVKHPFTRFFDFYYNCVQITYAQFKQEYYDNTFESRKVGFNQYLSDFMLDEGISFSKEMMVPEVTIHDIYKVYPSKQIDYIPEDSPEVVPIRFEHMEDDMREQGYPMDRAQDWNHGLRKYIPRETRKEQFIEYKEYLETLKEYYKEDFEQFSYNADIEKL